MSLLSTTRGLVTTSIEEQKSNFPETLWLTHIQLHQMIVFTLSNFHKCILTECNMEESHVQAFPCDNRMIVTRAAANNSIDR